MYTLIDTYIHIYTGRQYTEIHRNRQRYLHNLFWIHTFVFFKIIALCVHFLDIVYSQKYSYGIGKSTYIYVNIITHKTTMTHIYLISMHKIKIVF